MADDEDSTVLSDVDDDEDPSPSSIPSTSDTNDPLHQRIRDLLAELDRERHARQESEDALKRRDESINRLRAFAQDVIKKRDDAVRDKEDALSKLADSVKRNDDISKQLEESIREKDEILKQKDNLKSEVEIGSQMMVRGIDKISGKISDFKNFAAAGGLPRSQKYATGLPAVAYGVIKRANEIVEELTKQIEGATKSRDQAREQVEQRNYEIAIEVSQLEAAISGLKEEVKEKGAEIERLDELVRERDERNSETERLVKEMRGIGEERDRKLKGLEEKVNSWRPLVVDELSNVSKAYELIHEVVRVAGGEGVDPTWDSSFVWEEMDLDESLRMLLDGTAAVCATAEVAVERVRGEMEEKGREIDGLKEKVDGLVGEKQHIGTLLRSALQSKTNEVLQVAEDGLREAGIDLRFDERSKTGVEAGEVDEVFTLVKF